MFQVCGLLQWLCIVSFANDLSTGMLVRIAQCLCVGMCVGLCPPAILLCVACGRNAFMRELPTVCICFSDRVSLVELRSDEVGRHVSKGRTCVCV
jgi:hypothetical protein